MNYNKKRKVYLCPLCLTYNVYRNDTSDNCIAPIPWRTAT